MFATLFKLTSHGLLVMDAAGMITKTNPAMLKLLDFSDEQAIIGQPLAKFMLDDTPQSPVSNLEMTLRRRDGSLLICLANGDTSYDADGQTEFAFLQFNENPHYSFQEVLPNHSQHDTPLPQPASYATLELCSIFNSVNVGIFLIRNQLIARSNAKLHALFGYPPGELDGQPDRVLYPHDDAYQLITAAFAACFKQDPSFSMDLEMVKKNGKRFWCRIMGQALDKDDPQSGNLAILQDVSDEHQALQELVAAKIQAELTNETLKEQAQLRQNIMQRLKIATETAAVGVWTWEFADHHIDWDERMYLIYGLTASAQPQSITDDFWRGRLHPDDVAKIEPFLGEVKQHNHSSNENFRIFHTDGSLRYIDSGYIVERDLAGQPLRMIGFNRDITEKIEHQEKLCQAIQLADKANQAKSAFLANISHEIRTPMNAIIGLSTLLLDSELTEQQHDYLAKISHASKALLALINDILDYSKIEAGQLRFEKVPFNLADALRNTCNLFIDMVEAKGLKLLTEISPTVPTHLLGDGLRLEQVLKNLVGNAVKFTQQGEICIKVTLDSTFKQSSTQLKLRFSVSDTGIGIAPDYITSLFTPFSQADVSFNRRFGGTGLGLSICKHLVTAMDGEIAVTSQLEQGTTFSFSAVFDYPKAHKPLPSVVTAKPAPATNKADSLDHYIQRCAAIQGAEILLVEDIELNQLVMTKILEKLQLKVTLAQNGAEAIAWVRQKAFDLVLMDLQMPVMNGYQATQHIRALPQGQQLPIIATTASARDEDNQACVTAGMNGHLSKPIDINQLITRLLEWIR